MQVIERVVMQICSEDANAHCQSKHHISIPLGAMLPLHAVNEKVLLHLRAQ